MNQDKCLCGWILPEGVTAHPVTQEPSEKNTIPDSCVQLSCPVCQRGHVFLNVEDESTRRLIRLEKQSS